MSPRLWRLSLSSLLGVAAASGALALTAPARADMMCGGNRRPMPAPAPSPSAPASAGPFAQPPVGRPEGTPPADAREASRHQSIIEFGMLSGMAVLGVFAGLSRKKKDPAAVGSGESG
jgi:hypothetical protein